MQGISKDLPKERQTWEDYQFANQFEVSEMILQIVLEELPEDLQEKFYMGNSG